MKPNILDLELDLPRKPLYTKPCNGCGLCCLSQLCPIGEITFPETSAPCPALVFESGMARCGVVMAEAAAQAQPLVAKALGIGCGCSMPDSTTTDEEIDAFERRSLEIVSSPEHDSAQQIQQNRAKK